jgi:prolyl oligopeptidase PreP (S9A serine peptidase family)
MAQTDEYSLNKSDLKKLLEDASKTRCFDLEDQLGFESEIELFSFDSGKYLVYFSDDKTGVLYGSKQELIEVATPPSEIPEYEDWIEDMCLTLEDVTNKSKAYPPFIRTS